MYRTGNPLEVMGLLLGRPDPLTPHTLVVTDAFPLPIEGFETRVVADDGNVINHMITLGESLELTRKEKFMGWYHSHPFDLGEHSHCFLSQTDLTTQLQWQRAEDPHGNPFVAVVVGPLRSIHTEKPELKAFRAYPPDYNSPVTNECPDGTVEISDQLRLEQWGSCWNRYYELEVVYFMSTTSRRVIVEGLTQDSLWMRTLVRAAPEKLIKSTVSTAKEFKRTFPAITMGGGGGSSSSASGPSAAAGGTATGGGSGTSEGRRGARAAGTTAVDPSSRTREWNKAVQQLTDVAIEQLAESSLQKTKSSIFGAQ